MKTNIHISAALSLATMGVLLLGASDLQGQRPLGGQARGKSLELGKSQKAQQPHIDIAICLDTSGSMNGLLDSARQSIWTIVNDLALAKPTPRLRIALLTYGNDGHPQANGWVKIETGLTQDLDLVSERLFAQTLNGGTELVGRVLQAALNQLEWTRSPGALKLILVAGNESADQDKMVNFRDQCKKAIGQGIMINSIYCGNPVDNIAPGWMQIAKLSDGHFDTINQNETVAVTTPFDAKLRALSSGLNETYIPIGGKGRLGLANQASQDANAVSVNGQAAAQRANSKSGSNYFCSWDLLDSLKAGRIKLADVKKEDLPKIMQKMGLEERQEYVDSMGKKRAAVQSQISGLSKKRQGWVKEELKKRSKSKGESFENAVRKSIRMQAKSKGLSFKEDSGKPSGDSSKEVSGKTTGAEPKRRKM